MRRRRALVSATGVLCTLVLAGCATSGYDPGRIESELVKAGATPAQARCVTNGLSDTFAISQLGSHSEPNAQRTKKQPKNEYDKTRDILKRCGVTLPLNPIP